MGRLQPDTEELPAVPTFTPEEIQNGLNEWSGNLAKAKAEGNIANACLAIEWIDRWLDRFNARPC